MDREYKDKFKNTCFMFLRLFWKKNKMAAKVGQIINIAYFIWNSTKIFSGIQKSYLFWCEGYSNKMAAKKRIFRKLCKILKNL